MFAASKSAKAAVAAATTDTSFSYVPLLLKPTTTNGQQNNTFLDSSTNNFTITRNGTPTQGSVTPYWTSGQWSNYFNGSTDYFTVPSNAALTFGTSSFTFEAWVYSTSTSGSGANLADSTTNGFSLGLNSTNKIELAQAGVAVLLTSSTSVTLNQWTHIACVRNGTAVAIYINGVSSGTATLATSFSTSITYLCRQAGAAASYFPGYVSNLRIVNGTAVYTAAFTPPTTPLTAITNTSLLTCQSNRFIDNSTNAFAITANGTPKVQAFQPFSPTASYTTATYGGSGYFNGSTDYLTGAANAALAIGTGQFTLEMWIYFNSLASSPNEIFRTSTDGVAGRLALYYASGSLQIVATGGAGGTSASYTFLTGQWYHVAASRDSSNNQRLFVNGALLATATSTNNYTQNGFNLGQGSTVGYTNGYVSNLRLVNGTAVYTAAFTPPTAPVTAITNTSLLLNFTNAGIYDAAVQNNVITVGDAQASTTQYKWSPTSMKYDGTGDWLTAIDSPQLQLGTGDFTIEGWLYLSANGVIYGIVSKGTATTGWSVNVTVLNKLQFSYTASNLTGTTSLAASTWYYFAVVRSGSATGNLKVYLNGSVEATSGGAVTDNFNQTNILYIGADRIGSTPLNGYLQDVRITKLARTITTPTAAFPTR